MLLAQGPADGSVQSTWQAAQCVQGRHQGWRAEGVCQALTRLPALALLGSGFPTLVPWHLDKSGGPRCSPHPPALTAALRLRAAITPPATRPGSC